MALWHLFPKTLTSLRLWRTGHNSFRVVEYGEPTDVLTNYDYLLFDKKYGETLLKSGKQISISQAIVHFFFVSLPAPWAEPISKTPVAAITDTLQAIGENLKRNKS